MDRFLDLLEEAFTLAVKIYATEPLRGPMYKPEDFKVEPVADNLQGVPESPLETFRANLDARARGTSVPEGSGPQKRKRGRPRKVDSIKVEVKKDEQKTYTCPHCHGVLREAIRELHEPNCKAGAQGYASHEATPGK